MRSVEEPAAPTATGTIPIHGLPVRVLCNVGAMHSFISDAYEECWFGFVLTEGIPFSIGLPDGSRVIGTHVICVCLLYVETLMCLSPLCRDLYVLVICLFFYLASCARE